MVARGIGLDGMGENVHTGSGGDGRGHRAREASVEDGHVRDEHVIVQRDLDAVLLVRDDRNGGDFRTRAAGGGNGRKHRAGKVFRGLAGKIDDRLGRIDGRAAAKGDHKVGLACRVGNGPLLDRLQRRIGLHVGEDLHRDVTAFKMAGDLCGKAALHHKGIRHDERARTVHFFKGIERILAVADFCFAIEMHVSAPVRIEPALPRQGGSFCRHPRSLRPAEAAGPTKNGALPERLTCRREAEEREFPLRRGGEE